MDHGRILLDIMGAAEHCPAKVYWVVHVVLGLGSWAVCLIQYKYSQDGRAQQPSKDLQQQIADSGFAHKSYIMHPKC